ncbi:MAG: anaerobic ribonucleoside-triphosphate reductase activating protein [Clostridia bacterium]|nr:anaerobic ribonucleoside-triphosphate reductase activating protein [Clostridia bacterium]
MSIVGLQKMTLLDYPGHVACTVFLSGCNFRCPFCHNAEICDPRAEPFITEEELLAFLKKRAGLLDGVALTGGEPLMTPELPELIGKIRALGYPVKLDTDGYWPDRLAPLLREKLVDYVAMDVKNDPDRYAVTCGVEHVDLSRIRESIRLIMDSGIEYEFRTTVVDQLHDEKSFEGIAEMISGAERYFLQAFRDRDTVVFSGLSAPDRAKMERYAAIAASRVRSVELRGV